jgi:hypothetical protein
MFSSCFQVETKKKLLRFEDISHPTTLNFVESFCKATHVEIFIPHQTSRVEIKNPTLKMKSP